MRFSSHAVTVDIDLGLINDFSKWILSRTNALVFLEGFTFEFD